MMHGQKNIKLKLIHPKVNINVRHTQHSVRACVREVIAVCSDADTKQTNKQMHCVGRTWNCKCCWTCS